MNSQIHKFPEERKFNKYQKSPSHSKFTKTPFHFHHKVILLISRSRQLPSSARAMLETQKLAEIQNWQNPGVLSMSRESG